MLHLIEKMTTTLSGLIWPFFLPLLIIIGIFVGGKTIFVLRPLLLSQGGIKLKHMVGPVSISLGAMIGTGAIIGVLGSLNKLFSHGQIYFEALALWGCIGALVLVPLTYSEVLVAKITKSPPQKYLTHLLHPIAAKTYAIAFIILYIFGFGGFQFSGIDSAINIINVQFFDLHLTINQRYFLVVVPLILICAGIVLTKMHDLFIGSLTWMIGVAVVLYFTFFTIFVFKTLDYIPIFWERIWLGMQQPVAMLVGVPSGFILGAQRVMQTSETGLGALGMASLEANSKPKEAGIIALIPTVVTIFVAIVITTYITSYGYSKGIINLTATTTATERLTGFIYTAVEITGWFGLFVLILFTILSGLTTLLGSYYFICTLTDLTENYKILVYFVLIMISGTLAVFGFTIVFDLVDLLLFLVTGLNVLGLAVFVTKRYKLSLVKFNLNKD